MSDSEKVTVSKKFWKASHGAWYVKLIQPNGSRKDRRLKTKPGLSEKQAEDAAEGVRQKLIEEFEKAGRPTLDCTVDRLIQLFLAHVEANNEKATFKWYLELPEGLRRVGGQDPAGPRPALATSRPGSPSRTRRSPTRTPATMPSPASSGCSTGPPRTWSISTATRSPP